ncbi:hypothetical protein KLP40_18245 [Hymenobacter sp. NST-14]|uniref:hypothetical protein n=1 Tax=Hymenobacter piscis TaxID=2839984 RepID=UPI001C013305|nr:hypothetical protein [Hymenobacter piscis]MBT9395114.1 hypothetical protein [Hymenobacter piscis]
MKSLSRRRFNWSPMLLLLLTSSLSMALLPLWTAYRHLSAPAATVIPAGSPALLLTLAASLHLLLGAAALGIYSRSRQTRHWHPRVGFLSPVHVLPGGELSQPVSRRIAVGPHRPSSAPIF